MQCNLLFIDKPSIVTPVRVRSDKRHCVEKQTEGKDFGMTKEDLGKTWLRNSRDNNGEKESRVFQLLSRASVLAVVFRWLNEMWFAIKIIELKLWKQVGKNTTSQQNLLFCFSTPIFKLLFLNSGVHYKLIFTWRDGTRFRQELERVNSLKMWHDKLCNHQTVDINTPPNITGPL